MRFLIFTCLFLQCVFLECYGSYNLTSDLVTLKDIGNFKEHQGTDRWYREDEDGNNLGDQADFTSNIIQNLIKTLSQEFDTREKNYQKKIDKILIIINDFIRNKFIPPQHRKFINQIFFHTKGLQNVHVPEIRVFIFEILSENAQKKFKDGTRIQLKDLEHVRFNPNSKQFESTSSSEQFEAPDPELVEILFIQQISNAADASETFNDFLKAIEEIMRKMETLFSHNQNFEMIRNFDNLRAKIKKIENEESPFPATISFSIDLGEKHVKTFIKKHRSSTKHEQELLDNLKAQYHSELSEQERSIKKEQKIQTEWEEITNKKANSHISIWKKKELPKQKTQAEIDEEKKEKEKKAKKSWFKNEVKGTKDKALEGLEKTGANLATQQFSGLMNSFTNSIKSILPFG